MAHTHPLEGDGIQVNLFHYLWKQPPGVDYPKIRFRIVDTIVLYNFPIAWYYYSTSHQEVRRRPGRELDRSNIINVFSAKRKIPGYESCDVVASFLSHRSDEEDRIYFFNTEELKEFLMGKPTHQGLLQKFMLPKGPNNELTQVVWSPQLCLVSKRVNRLRLNDLHHSRNEKCVTYEGPTHFTEEAVCAEGVRTKMEDICQSLVDHFKQVEHDYTITRMVLYFKEDHYKPNIMWLHFSNSFRISESRYHEYEAKTPVALTPHFLGLHTNVPDHNSSMKTRKPASRYRTGFLKNIHTEDMSLLASVAYSAGMASEDEGAMIGLTPLSDFGLPSTITRRQFNSNSVPTSPRQESPKKSKLRKSDPNDTVKSEMLLERIYFNNKTKQIRSDIQRWEIENKKILGELDQFRKLKAVTAGALTRLWNRPKPRSKAYDSPETVAEASSPLSSDSGGEELPHNSSLPLTKTGSESYATLMAQSIKSKVNGNSTQENYAGHVSPAQPVPAKKKKEIEPQVNDSQNSIRRKKKRHEEIKELREQEERDKERRIQEALGMLTREPKRVETPAPVVVVPPPQIEVEKEEICNSNEEVQRIMNVVASSIEKHSQSLLKDLLSKCSVLDDIIYSCYSELSLKHKPRTAFRFSLPCWLSDVFKENFSDQMKLLNIVTSEQYRKMEEAWELQRREREARKIELANRLAKAQGKKIDIPAVVGNVKATESKTEDEATSPTVTSEAEKDDDGETTTDPNIVDYCLITEDNSTVNEFMRLMKRIESYLVGVLEQEQRALIDRIRSRVKSISWVQLMEEIKADS